MIAEAMPWKLPLVRARLLLRLVATFLGLLAISISSSRSSKN